MTDKLEPCPFCGSEIVADEYGEKYPHKLAGKYTIVCMCCDESITEYGRKHTIEKWNTRPIEAKLRAEIADLTSQCTECKEPADCPVKAELRERDREISALKKELRHLIGKDFIPGLDS